MLVFAALVLSSVLGTVISLQTDWNQDTRDYILDIHNDFRRNEGGCQINKFEYDMDLERQARQWAERCVFKHEMKKGRGENLAWDSSHDAEKELIKGSAQRWFDEKKDYSFGQRSCGRSCHYTQLVWHSTKKVGCWTTRCPNLQYAYRDAWYLVCFYTPMGNMMGEQPYKRRCDTPCLAGQTEENGLCVGEASGSSGDGGSGGGSESCVDTNKSCAMWAKSGQCQLNPQWMNKNCRLSCKVCTVTKSEGGSGDGGSEGGSESCVDTNESCAMWAKGGQCQQNPQWMNKNCRLACKACTVTKTEGGDKTDEDKTQVEDCKDISRNCGTWAKQQQCQANPGWMHKNCKLSCKICTSGGDNGSTGSGGNQGKTGSGSTRSSKTTGSTGKSGGGCDGSTSQPCEDKKRGCPRWAKRGSCSTNPHYMERNCKKSCQLC